MKIEEVRNIARTQGMQPGKLTKTELIRAIQSEEGNFDCYATAYHGECDQGACSWREDCFQAARKE